MHQVRYDIQIAEPLEERGGRNKKIAIAVCILVLLTALIAILALMFLIPGIKKEYLDKLECPYFQDEKFCIKAGCRWLKTIRGPNCYMEKSDFGYLIKDFNISDDKIFVELTNNSENSIFGPSITDVNFEVSYLTENILRFKLTDATNKRYEVPVQEKFPLLQTERKVNVTNLAYELILENTTPKAKFEFKIRRKSDKTTLWDTSIGGLLMSDQFLQMSSYLPTENIYGIGEHPHESFKHDMDYKTWPLFSRDQPPRDGIRNLYGVHPFYTCLEKNGKSHGVLFLNSNAMEITMMPSPAISFRTIGGILDFFVFVGDNPEHTIQLYTLLIGRPIMPPYWSLGLQLSRYGYNNISNVKDVIERTRNASITQDVQFLDIDHMEGNRDFTWNKKSFKDLNEYIKKTKEEYGLRWIIILDPAIEAISTDYDVYTTGITDEVFIKRSPNWNQTMFPDSVRNTNVTYGKVWPKEIVAFPDFLNEKSSSWWKKIIVNYHKELAFDGLWIDMNEPANFGTNEEDPDVCKWQQIPKDKCWVLRCPKSPLDDPPYNPLLSTGTNRLSKMTLCMSSVQGKGDASYQHYDVHSLYGWSQSIATLEAAEESTKTRSLVISRSTYPSSGQYCGHWLGDNESRWPDLHRSIIGMLEFNLFGIPYIGADICGFFEDTTDDMCKRWMQLGAFYPFFRNHNGMGQKDQDPAAMGGEVLEASKYAVERRYRLLPYLYTLFYRSHIDGNTVVRPLFHEFPTDKNTWNVDKQFLWGKHLLISPVLNQAQDTVKLYLPKSNWYQFDYEKSIEIKENGEHIEYAVRENIPLHVRAGAIIPIQDYHLKSSLQEPVKNITLYVFPEQAGAEGELFHDDGLTKDTVKNGNYFLFGFKEEPNFLSFTLKKKSTGNIDTEILLKEVLVFKVLNQPDNVMVNDVSHKDFMYNEKYQVLTVRVNKKMVDMMKIQW